MKIIDIIKIAINSSENLSKEKRNECIEYINTLQQENARLKDKIENATKFVDEYMDEWDFHDEVWEDLNNLLILLKEN